MEEAKHPFPAEPPRVIHTKGSDREIGRSHALAVGEGIHQGMLKFYWEFWQQIFTAPSPDWPTRAAIKAAKWGLEQLPIKHFIRQVPPGFRDRIQGIRDVTQIPLQQMLTSLVLPDLLPLLESYINRVCPDRVVPVSFPSFGCSSFLSRGRHFFFGRNLDFPGVGYWDRYPVLQVIEQPNQLRYLALTTAGAPLGGITGINEAQIAVGVHQHYASEASLRGVLPYVVGEKILAKAKSLEEAREILDNARMGGPWAFVVADGKTKSGFVFEYHPKASAYRELTPDKPALAHTNYYHMPPCQPAEYGARARMNWDNFARERRLMKFMGRAGYDLDASQGVRFLSDHFDPYWQQEKVTNRTISMVHNIQSVLMDLENMKIYFAEGSTPVHLREYREYDLGAIFGGKSGRTDNVVAPYRFEKLNRKKAKRAYVFAMAASMDGDLEKSRRNLDLSLSYDFSPDVAYTGAVVNLKLGNKEPALYLLNRAAEIIRQKVVRMDKQHLPPEYFEIWTFLGRTYDLMGKRGKALSIYRQLAKHPGLEDMAIRKFAMREEIYTERKLSRVLAPFASYVPFQ